MIHFFMAFDWLLLNWFPWLTIFTIKKGLPGPTYAYILALTIITYSIIKVNFGFYAKSRLNQTINLYKIYIKENEIDLLANYIRKYHSTDIQLYLKGISNLPRLSTLARISRQRTTRDIKFDQLTNKTRIQYASRVYGHIIQNKNFVRKTANKYPGLFATIFIGMETQNSSNEELINLYIKCLFENKNQLLAEELKIMADTEDSILKTSEEFEIPIIYSLLSHTKTAAANHVWYPVGEGGIASLKYDQSQKDFLLKEYTSELEAILWEQKIYIAVVYFNSMVRESIYRDSEYHMWLHYFRYFIENIIDNIIPSGNIPSAQPNYLTFAHKLIDYQISFMINWLELAKSLDTTNRVIDTIRCIGYSILSICNAASDKISDRFKIDQVDALLRVYFQFSNYPENQAATLAREWIERLFLHPNGVDFGTPLTPPEYLRIVTLAWHNFDKIPYETNGSDGPIEHFTITVTDVLGIT